MDDPGWWQGKLDNVDQVDVIEDFGEQFKIRASEALKSIER